MACFFGSFVLFLANSVLSFSALVMLCSRKADSCCSSWRRMCWAWRLRIVLRLGLVGGMVMSSLYDGHGSSEVVVAKAS
jgi:hypothetical protein